jgi:crotonobetainyl-CoA:carnitine CoA-transferase CaiB-like acyl-CoA transferase
VPGQVNDRDAIERAHRQILYSHRMPEDVADPQDVPAKPLAGIRVLDLTRVLAGPFCTLILADLGAEVIKLEEPGAPDYTRSIPPHAGEISHYFLAANRGKKSISVDLKSEEGRRIGFELASRVDVVVENFRPGVLRRLGLDYETLAKVNPGIVVCSISGFGQTGSHAGKAAVDVVVQALSGVMSTNGEPGGDPTKLGIAMGDLAGAMWAAVGAVAALRRRELSGRGAHVDVALVDGLTSMLSYLAQLYLITGEEPARTGNRHLTVPGFGPYRTADEEIALSVQMDGLWQRFCKAADRPELADDERYRRVPDRQARFAEVEALISEILLTRPIAEWEERLEAVGVPNGRVLDIGGALESDHAKERGIVREIDQPGAGPVRVVGPVIRFQDASDAGELAPAPLLGQHTREVLGGLGISADELEGLLAAGVIRETPAR